MSSANFWSSRRCGHARIPQPAGHQETRWSTQLIERVVFATDRDDLVAATHALDRVLLWNYYVVPQYHKPEIWLA